MNAYAKKWAMGLLAVSLQLSSHALWALDTDGDGVPDVPSVTHLSVGLSHACALDDNGAHCWGNSGGSIPTLTNPVALSTGEYHSCALDDNGVHCWGWNPDGQTSVPALSNPVAIGAGYSYSCAVDDNGVQCWGGYRPEYPQLDHIPTLTDPVAVAAGRTNTCALDDNGLHCWDGNGPTVIPTLDNPVAVSAGLSHVCALDDNGVHCWGNNGSGKADVPTLDHPVAVSAGYNNTCAIDASGVHCWGSNTFGQNEPPTLDNPVAVSVGVDYACALDDNGVHCWGDSSDNQTTVPAILTADNCPFAANADQLDGDGDGLGNVCDPLPEDGNALGIQYGAVKADKTGTVVAFAGDFNQDGFGDYVVGTPGYDVPAAPPAKAINNAGKVEIISGNNGGSLYVAVGTPKSGFGTAVAGDADVNGDGIADVVVSAPLAAGGDGEKAMGKVTVIYGCKAADCVPVTANVYGSEAKALFGAALALGDADNDGKADVAIGSPKAANTQGEKLQKQAGAVTVLSGVGLSGTPLLTVYGAAAKAHAGAAVALGDFDGQAGAEVIVGAPNDNDVDTKNIGSVTVYRASDATVLGTQYGQIAKDGFGGALAAGRDVNGDGLADVLVGAPGSSNPADSRMKNVGGVAVLYGSSTGNYYLRSAPLFGPEPRSGFGAAVALADVNADGHADLVVGAAKATNPDTLPKATKATGSVSVWKGAAAQPFTLFGTTRYGDAKGHLFGASVSAGDTNRDNKADLIIGIPGFVIPPAPPAKTVKNAGSVRVVNATSL